MTPAMKPDDIPEDVWEAAGRALGSPDMPRDMIRKRIGRAIMAERERAMREGYMLGFNASGEWVESRDQVIAAAIRQER